MEAVLVTLAAGLLAALLTWMLVRASLKLLIAYSVVDRPDRRSSHEGNVPTGGGIAVISVILPCWMCLALITGTLGEIRIIVASAAILAGISFIDDVRHVPQLVRLAAHVAAVALGLTLLPDAALLFDGLLPYWADRLATGLAWVWFINLFNFMDGIDGITGVETIAVAGGLAAALLLTASGESDDWSSAALAAVLAGAATGFLVLNWHPARLFLGDAGSVPLGYLLGWLLVWTACASGPLVARIGVAVVLLDRRHDDTTGAGSEGGENMACPSPPRLSGRSPGWSKSRCRGRVHCLNQCRSRPPSAAGGSQGDSRLVDDHPGRRPDLNGAATSFNTEAPSPLPLAR